MTSCVNCELSLKGTSTECEDDLPVTDFLLDFPNCPKRVTVYEAVCTLIRPKPVTYHCQDLVMCSGCGSVLDGIFRSYIELMKLSKATADICKLVHQVENWHRAHADGDFNYFSFLSTEPDVLMEESQEPETDFKDLTTMDENETDEFVFRKEIKTVPKKRKINASLGASEDESLEAAKRTSRRKSNKPVRIMTKEIHGSSEDEEEEDNLDDEDFDPEHVQDEWIPNVRRSGRISQARLKQRKQRADTKIRRKKLRVKYTGKHSKIKANSQKSAYNLIEKRKRGRPPNSVEMNVKVENKLKIKLSRIKVKVVDHQPPSVPPSADDFDFEVAPPEKKRYKRSKQVPEKKPVICCADCPAKYYTRWMLEHHVNTQHLNIVPKECSECGLKYFKDEIIQTHVCIPFAAQEEDRRQRPFVCELCGRSMANRGNFSHHNMSHDHAEESRLKCGQCKLTFKRIENLQKHEKIHAMPKNSWQCDICGKVFFVKRRLKEHNEIHLEQKRYMCSICGMRFAQQKAMIRHGTIHANLNRYLCPLCGKGFKRKDHLHQHFRSKVHPRALIESVKDQNVGPLPMELFRQKPEEETDGGGSFLIIQDSSVEESEPQTESVYTETQSSPKESNTTSPSSSAHASLDQNQTQLHLPQQQIMVLPIHALAQHQAEFGFSDLLSL